MPVTTRRSLVRGEDVTPDRLTRWRRIVKEAAEQSGRGLLPEVRPPLSLEEALDQLNGYAKSILLWEGAGGKGIAPALAELPSAPAVALFIGPEGGYEDAEVDQARAAGATVATLGPRILRTETAAIAAVTLTLHALGEMA
jgi:16S rRNA (uracil1498-N3)-methyltransferase